MLFDTHAHLCADAFDGDRIQTIRRAIDSGITTILEAGTSVSQSERALALAHAHDGVVAAAGVHPHEASEAAEGYLDRLASLLGEDKCVAVGEIGLDYHYDFSPRDVQRRVFDQQLSLAAAMKKPVIIHDREAHKDVLDALQSYAGRITGVMHCYSGSLEDARKYLDMGFFLSFGGPITFANAVRPKQVAAYAPLESILCETDCPYLTPAPYRGKRNEPMHVRLVAEALAALKGLPFEALAQATTQNGKRLFRL
jgi:TatD DNase family protein